MGGAARNRGGTKGHGSLPLAGAKLNWNQHIISDKLLGKAFKFLMKDYDFKFIFTVGMVDHGKSRLHHVQAVGLKYVVKELRNFATETVCDTKVNQRGTIDKVKLSVSKKVSKDKDITKSAEPSLHCDKLQGQLGEPVHSGYTQERIKPIVIVKTTRKEDELSKNKSHREKQPANQGSEVPLTSNKEQGHLGKPVNSGFTEERFKPVKIGKSTRREDQ